MDFRRRYTEQQEALRREVSTWLEARLARAGPSHLIRLLGDRGWLLAACPPDWGGPGLSGEEQVVIAEYLDAKEHESHLICSTIESQIATLTAYRKSLIHECLTGQRRITETDINRVKAHG